jgi:hypothetical protein
LWQKLGKFKPAKPIMGVISCINGTNTIMKDPMEITWGFCKSWKRMFHADPTPRPDADWTEPPCILPAEIEALMAPISEKEYAVALQCMHQGSLGSDGIDACIVRALPTDMHNML